MKPKTYKCKQCGKRKPDTFFTEIGKGSTPEEAIDSAIMVQREGDR